MEDDNQEAGNKRYSSVVSSDESSVISTSSDSDYTTQVYTLTTKSSSMSCLSDHISTSENNILTLPHNLDAVKVFEENLPPKETSLNQSLYQTAQDLNTVDIKDENSSSNDEKRKLDIVNAEANTDSCVKDNAQIDLTSINTVTHTYVRSSALDILSKFPMTETVPAVESSNNCSTLDVLKEDDGFMITDGKKSSNVPPVTSWSSTSGIERKPKSNKKLKEAAKQSKSSEKLGKDQKSPRKEKAKSGKFLNIFRGKTYVEKSKEKKQIKQRKPVQKSQSFDSNSLPRNAQLNRMDSFRKMFKRHREPTTNSRQSVEISSPILKSDFKSRKLVDREVILRERAHQMDKKKNKKVRNKEENDVIIYNSKVSENNCDDNIKTEITSVNQVVKKLEKNGEKDSCHIEVETSFENTNGVSSEDFSLDETIIDGDNNDSSSKVECINDSSKENDSECDQSPIPPIRHKHIEMKQRLSVFSLEDSPSDDHCSFNGQSKIEENLETEEHHSECDEEKAGYSNDSLVSDDEKDKNLLNHHEKKNNDEKKDNLCKNNQESEVSDGTDETTERNVETNHEGNKNEDVMMNTNSITVSCDNLNTITTDDTTESDEFLSQEIRNFLSQPDFIMTHEKNDDNVSRESQQNVSISLSPGSEDGDVFVDATCDEKFSFDVAKPMDENASTKKVRSSNTRCVSDVTSKQSSSGLNDVPTSIKGKQHSFPGAKSTSNHNQATTSASFTRSNKVPGRTPTFLGSFFSSDTSDENHNETEAISMITDMVPVSFPNFLTDRRSQIVLELFTTERTYVRSLETMIELFKKPMLSSSRWNENDVNTIFSNVDDIFALNKDLLFLLWAKIKHWSHDQCFGHLFIDMEERFKIYATYCQNFDNADAMLKRLRRNKEFDRFLKSSYQDPLCQPGLDLPAYLITIVQRIPRYLLLLKDLLNKTPTSHPDYNTLQIGFKKMNKVAEYINSQVQVVYAKKAMQELRSAVIGLKAYEVGGRILLKEGEICLMSPKKQYKCLLFNDIIVFAVQGANNRSEIEMKLELKTLWFEDLKKQDPQTNKYDAIELYTPHRPYTMYAGSRTEKRVWIQKLRTAIVTLLYKDCDDPDVVDISRRKASDTYFDGSVYCGDYVNGKRHGDGIMAWPNRTRYEGSWVDDERHDHGKMTYNTGEIYDGNWVADKKHGEGRQTYVNGDSYIGLWKDGKMHGEGVIAFSNGDCYEGEMYENEVEGYGEMICNNNGMIYKGDWKNSKRHGKGYLSLPNGNVYKGEMLNDRICGQGEMIYFNGDQYTGEWVNELRHGSGCFHYVNGTIYDGQWHNDFMNGQGKMIYPNGDEYVGTWHENKRVGFGQLICAYGDTYDGQWQDDTMHGKGVMTYKDDSIYDGQWNNGQRHGRGKTVYKDKSIYDGEYFHGFRHGQGILTYATNVFYQGQWKRDKFDGNGRFSDPNNDYSYTGDWSCGMREGSGIEISSKRRYEGNWKADMKHGSGVEISHAGHVFTGTWKENRKHGEGSLKLRWNAVESQHWFEGRLIDGGETVAEGLPPLPRR